MHMNLLVAVIIVLVILLVFWHVSRATRCQSEREFMTGFWRASPMSCDMAGYREAYLYMGAPKDDTNISRAYIVALRGGRGTINRPFDFDAEHAWTNNGKVCGKININGQTSDVAIDLDLLIGRMVWRDAFGKPLFVWDKDSQLTSRLF